MIDVEMRSMVLSLMRTLEGEDNVLSLPSKIRTFSNSTPDWLPDAKGSSIVQYDAFPFSV